MKVTFPFTSRQTSTSLEWLTAWRAEKIRALVQSIDVQRFLRRAPLCVQFGLTGDRRLPRSAEQSILWVSLFALLLELVFIEEASHAALSAARDPTQSSLRGVSGARFSLAFLINATELWCGTTLSKALFSGEKL